MGTENLGDRVERLRITIGLTQKELASKLDLEQSTVSRIESGQRQVLASEIPQLSDALGTSIEQLISGDQAVAGPTLLRATEAHSEELTEAIEVFNHCIDEYRGLEALAGGS